MRIWPLHKHINHMPCLEVSFLCLIICCLSQINLVDCVRGCVTFALGEDYSMRQSICDKVDTHFTTIPSSLPSQVVKLTINHQEITRLNASQLQHLPNLTYLNLDSNKLVFIHPDTFHNLLHLRTLSLRYNLLTISDHSFHPNVILGLSGLVNLNLLNNPIGTIPNYFFAPMGKNLRTLVLAGSSDHFRLEVDSLADLVKLQSLDLSHNHLETLPETFERCLNQMQLQELYLHGNPWRCDCHLRWLNVWFLRHNSKLIHSKLETQALLKHPVGSSSSSSSSQTWFDTEPDSEKDSKTHIQPRCATPVGLYGRPLFHSRNTVGLNNVDPTDFHCLPEARTPNQEIYLNQGSNSSLMCEFFADPSGIVVWYKDGTRIQNHWPRMSTNQEQGRRFQAQLLIYDTQMTDAGTYVCYLDTGYGRVNSTITVKVEGSSIDVNMRDINGVFRWISRLDTTLVLKYTGIIASCLIILLMLMGLFIYCFYGRKFCRMRSDATKSLLNSTTNKFDSPEQNNMVDSHDNVIISKTDNQSLMMLMTTTTATATIGPTTGEKHEQNQRSSTIKKSNLRSIESLEKPILGHSNDVHSFDTGRNLRLISKTDNLDNYVTVRLLPTVTQTELATNCPLHNYTVLKPIRATDILLNDSNVENLNQVDSQPIHDVSRLNGSILPSATTKTIYTNLESTLSNPLTNLSMDSSTYISLPPAVSVLQPSANFENKSSDNMGSSIYLPCPLHGNLYATLQTNRDKKPNPNTTSELRKHIANVPAGLGTTFDKRHTLPNRKIKSSKGELKIQTELVNGEPDSNHSSGIQRSNQDDFVQSRPKEMPDIQE